MHRIGVISDTHGLLREEVREQLKECDVILHGGDVNKQKILDELGEIAPVYVVRGNNDKEWAEYLPETLELELYGIRIFMTHNKKQVKENYIGKNLVIYGHSHKYEEIRKEGQCWLNPGSCGPRRFSQPVTMAVVEVEDAGTFRIRRVDIRNGAAGKEEAKTLPGDMRRIVCGVMRDVEKGRNVSEIAKRNGIGEELAEQICRLYLTHPGVDEEGILRKMGL